MKKIFSCFTCIGLLFLAKLLCAQTWNKVGTGVWGYGNGLGIYNNYLYFGGGYSTSPEIDIAKWDGTTWTPVDSVSGQGPYCFLEYNNELYVGGRFASIQGTTSWGIAKWNGTQWVNVGATGISGGTSYINSLNVLNGEIYVSGKFPIIGGVNTKCIARWNGSNWSAVDGGLSFGNITPNCYVLALKNDLYVGGDFGMAGNIPSNNIARWNGTQWDSVGAGIGGIVNALALDTVNDFLYAGGSFFSAGNQLAYAAAFWNGYVWKGGIDSGFFSGYISDLAMYHHELYAVGYFVVQGGEGVAKWNGTYWEAVGGGTTPGGNDVEAAEVYKDELYVCGNFWDAGGDTSIKWIARWYSPPDTTCKFLQPVIEAMLSLAAPNGVSDTFYTTDSVQVQFYNNIASSTFWQWDFGDGDAGSGKTPVHYYTAAGTYTVSVIVNYPYGPNGPCMDTAYKTITIISTVGVNEHPEKIKFKVYPNPAKREINIMPLSGSPRRGEGKYIVRVKNSMGKNVYENTFVKTLKINSSSFKKGIYLVEVCDLTPCPSPTGEGRICHTEKVMVE